jgi:hypothetical protein
MVVISGTTESPAAVTHQFADVDSPNGTEQLVFGGGSTVLVPVYDVRRGSSIPLALFGMYPMRTTLWQINTNERRQVGAMNGFPACSAPDGNRTICYTRGANGGQIWMVDAKGTTTRLGGLRGSDAARVALGPGMRLTFAHATDQVTEVDAGAHRITDIRLPTTSGYVFEARTAGRRLAVLRQDAALSVTLYRLE